MPPDLHLLRPLWFLALVPLGLILLGLWRVRPGAGAWHRLVDPHLLPHLLAGADRPARRWPLALLALGWLLGVTALAGPVWERLPQPVFSTQARRVILLDLSPSMNASDLTPSRLARARFEVLDLLAATREGQVGLIAFGPEPFVVSPLTGDARTIADQVPRLATDLLPVPGARHPERALARAGELLAQAGGAGGEIILITDGLGDRGGGDPGTPAFAAARALAAAGHRLSVLGVGTPDGAPVPGPDGGFAAPAAGPIPISRLQRADLESLARAGGGAYVDLDAGDRDTRALIAAGTGPRAAETAAQPGLTADRWQEEGPWLLLALLPLAALGFRRGWLVPGLALPLVLPWLLLVPAAPAAALGWEDLWQRPDQQGARRLAAGDGAAAAERFADPAWRAAARYRAGDPAGALADLEGQTGAETDYNRGNALARLGRFDEAIAAYERTLAAAPGHGDARANLDLVRRLKDRKETQPENPDPQQGDQQGQDTNPSGQPGKGSGGGDPKPTNQGQTSKPQEGSGQSAAPAGGGQGQGTDQGQGADQNKGSEAPGQTEAGAPGAERPDAQGSAPSAPAGSGSAQSGGLGSAEPEIRLPQDPGEGHQATAGGAGSSTEPGTRAPATPNPAPNLTPAQREQQEAMEAQLRAVPDDPAGLLRQRFLLQQLRREGRLP